MHGARYYVGKFAELCADPQSRSHPRLFLGGRSADRGGVRRTTIGWSAGAAIFLTVFALPLPQPILYGALFLTGFVVFNSQA